MAEEFTPTGVEDVAGAPEGAVPAPADFNLDTDYKAPSLVPAGRYRGSVIAVKFNPKDNSIDWEVSLNGNGGVCSDGATPVDGIHLDYRNWLPNTGDENQMTKKGKQTKRQAKINMLKDFADGMKIDMGTREKIVEALQNSVWVGREVYVACIVADYQGRFFNRVDTMVSV